MVGGWSLFENCTVDASICGQVFKGARWMPRHQEPMKDVATKMLASTVQFSKYGQTRHHHHRKPTTTTPTSSLAASRPVGQRPTTTFQGPPTYSRCLFPQDPTVCCPTNHTISGEKLSAFHPQKQPPQTNAQAMVADNAP